MAKFVFVTGGVVSSLGKGIAVSALAAALKSSGYSVKIKKLDPYLNVDPGTMNPAQHGEVYVTDDGVEADLDLGHYERIGGIKTSRSCSVTSGLIYQELLNKERRGDYLGSTVQIIPHLTNLIVNFIKEDIDGVDFVLCEIGGTVGDIEGAPFLEAARQMKRSLGQGNVAFVHLTLLPYVSASQEIKTKPTQHSVKMLMNAGIEPDILLCRTEYPIKQEERKKLAIFCNVEEANVIEAPDLKSVYEAPLVYHKNGLDVSVLRVLGIDSSIRKADLTQWEDFVKQMNGVKEFINVAIVGKYFKSMDSYKSIIEALRHSAVKFSVACNIVVVPAFLLTTEEEAHEKLKDMHAIIVPGGFGIEQTEGKINAIKYARENNIPYLGICFGMQLAVIEFCRNVVGIKNAISSEFLKDDCTEHGNDCVIDLLEAWIDSNGKSQYRRIGADLGGTMHLGAYNVVLKPNTLAHNLYKNTIISERHRHRYQVVNTYKLAIEKCGGIFSGFSEGEGFAEIFELSKDIRHPFFIGCQFHPEFKSTPFSTSPFFDGLIKNAMLISIRNII